MPKLRIVQYVEGILNFSTFYNTSECTQNALKQIFNKTLVKNSELFNFQKWSFSKNLFKSMLRTLGSIVKSRNF